MSRCRKLSIVALTGCLLLTSAAGLHAQSDAETALENARVAYQADQFEEARDQAKKASQTAARNPDVWLMLGKAHFQLGELDEALVAWRNLLKLAPNHEYGRRMVSALEGQVSDIDLRIRLASVNVSEGFVQTARADLQSLRTRSPLSLEQRRKVLMLLAEVAVLEVKGTEALAILNELTTRDAATADTLPVRLLTARAQLVTGGALTTFGLAELTKIVEEAGDTPDAQLAKLELLLHRVSRGEDGVTELAAWIEENGTLTASRRARLGLRDSVQRYLAASAAAPAPKADAELNEHDKSALTAAGHAFKAFVDVADQTALATALTTHLEKRYVAVDAFAAARSGLVLIDQMQLLDAVSAVVAGSRRRIEVAEATSEYMQIKQDVQEAVAGPEVLAKWIADHPGHPMELDARQTLVTAYLDVTRRQPAPAADAELSASDKLAIAAVGAIKSTGEVSKLVQVLSQHFRKHYFDRGAHAAAIAGVEALVPLEVPARRAPLTDVVAGMQRDIATLEYT
jgi:tetratricopeptide (TPR) repeat protein